MPTTQFKRLTSPLRILALHPKVSPTKKSLAPHPNVRPTKKKTTAQNPVSTAVLANLQILSMKNIIFRLFLPAHYLLVLFDDQRMSRHPLPSPLMVANNKNLYNGFTTGTFNNQCHIKKIYLTIMFHKYIHATKPLVIHSTGCFISKSIFRLVCAFVTDLLPDSTFLPRFLHHVSLHPFTPAAWSHIT